MGPIERVYGKIKHFCLPAGTKHDLDVWMTGIRLAKVGVLYSTVVYPVCKLVQVEFYFLFFPL